MFSTLVMFIHTLNKKKQKTALLRHSARYSLLYECSGTAITISLHPPGYLVPDLLKIQNSQTLFYSTKATFFQASSRMPFSYWILFLPRPPPQPFIPLAFDKVGEYSNVKNKKINKFLYRTKRRNSRVVGSQ